MLIPQDVHDLRSQTLGSIHDTTFFEEPEVLDDEVTNNLLSHLLYLTEEVKALSHIAKLSNLIEGYVGVEDSIDNLGHELGLEGLDVVHEYII